MIGFCISAKAEKYIGVDTIDNWQIYLDDSLVAAGHQNMNSLPEVVLKKTNSRGKLRIVYNRDILRKTTKEIQIGSEAGKRFTQRYFGWSKPVTIKIKKLIELQVNDTLVLYFYDGPITMPSTKARGAPLVKIKFV